MTRYTIASTLRKSPNQAIKWGQTGLAESILEKILPKLLRQSSIRLSLGKRRSSHAASFFSLEEGLGVSGAFRRRGALTKLFET